MSIINNPFLYVIMKFNKFVPTQSRSFIRKYYHGLFDIQYWKESSNLFPGLGWFLHPQAYISRNRMRRFKNRHFGERCFIIGNGPSLKHMDLSPLRNEITFGLNRIYLIFRELGFQTTYYTSINVLVLEQCHHEIYNLKMPKFISWYARNFIGFSPDIFYIRDSYQGSEGFAEDPTWEIREGATVTFVAMQLAFFMGFKQVILIGVDHSFTTQGVPNSEIISQGDDPNHFDSSYFGKGFRWQLPDLEKSERHYKIAKEYYEHDGREIVDATSDGKLHVFPKVSFSSFF